MLNDLCRPVGKVFRARCHIQGLILDLDVLIALALTGPPRSDRQTFSVCHQRIKQVLGTKQPATMPSMQILIVYHHGARITGNGSAVRADVSHNNSNICNFVSVYLLSSYKLICSPGSVCIS